MKRNFQTDDINLTVVISYISYFVKVEVSLSDSVDLTQCSIQSCFDLHFMQTILTADEQSNY